MKILVTGANGFVGSRTCLHLEAAGHEVVRVSHMGTSGYAVDIGDISSFEALEHIEDIEAVVHCAGLAHRFGRIPQAEFDRVNVDGVRNVVKFCARKSVRRFVHLSSVLVYGTSSSTIPISEDQNVNPQDDYSRSKLAGEQAASDASSRAGINLVILRPVPIIGEGSRGNVARLIRAIDRKHFLWIGDGRNERSFVYVGDVAAAILKALSIPKSNCTLNVTGGKITVRGLVETIADSLGKPRPARLLPHQTAKLALKLSKPFTRVPKVGCLHQTLDTWLADAVYSGSLLMSLGFKPSVDLRDGIRREVEFYLASKR